jgi:TrmH family RNA methyltransferase
MVSKNQIKRITSLQQKKFRKLEQLFVVEGVKGVQELLDSNVELVELYTTNTQLFAIDSSKVHAITSTELQKISSLTTPNTCLALFKIPEGKTFEENGLIVAVDDVRDPGNLGTIIRLCDWFGIKTLYCSEESVDVYNPKVVQATMGSISRVNVVYGDLSTFLSKTKLPIFGTFMDGKNIYKELLPSEGIIVMGNEANGISKSIEELVSHRIAIPRFGDLQATESLNVATATAVVLSEFKRSAI